MSAKIAKVYGMYKTRASCQFSKKMLTDAIELLSMADDLLKRDDLDAGTRRILTSQRYYHVAMIALIKQEPMLVVNQALSKARE